MAASSPRPANSILSRASFANGDERYFLSYNPDEDFGAYALDERYRERGWEVELERGWDGGRGYDGYALSLHEENQRLEDEVRRKEEEIRRRDEEAKKAEQEMQEIQQEAKRMVEEGYQKTEDVRRREREVTRKEQDVNRKIENANRLVVEAAQKADEARKKEDEISRKEEKVKEDAERTRMLHEEANRIAEKARLKQETLRQMEEETQRKAQEIEELEVALKAREEELKRREDEARKSGEDPWRSEAEAWRKKEDEKLKEEIEKTRRMQQEANRIAEQARLTQETLTHLAEETRRKEQEIEERERALKAREDDLKRRVEEARMLEEEARRMEEDEISKKEVEKTKRIEANRVARLKQETLPYPPTEPTDSLWDPNYRQDDRLDSIDQSGDDEQTRTVEEGIQSNRDEALEIKHLQDEEQRLGRPPFQTKDVKAIYKRIRDNEYEFPPDRAVSRAVLLIQTITPDPSQRHEIVDHRFLSPDVNLKRLRKSTQLDVDYAQLPPSTSMPSMPSSSITTTTTIPLATNVRNITSTIAQQEREFQKAVQPGSPISALLSSARQPLLMTNPGGNGKARESPLLRKLQVVKESPLGRRTITQTLEGNIEEKEVAGGRRRPAMASSQDEGDYEEEELRLRKKELESQKARIVAQMAPVKEEVEGEIEEVPELPPVVPSNLKARERYGGALTNRENVAPSAPPPSKYGSLKGKDRPQVQAQPLQRIVSRKGLVHKETTRIGAQIGMPSGLTIQSTKAAAPLPPPNINGFDLAAETLCAAFEARAAGRIYIDPQFGSSIAQLPEEKVFIVSWVDYCNKYGMGYALTDGSVGVHFNDTTTLVLSPDKVHFDDITPGSAYRCQSYSVEMCPERLKSKLYLLKQFENYIMDRLYDDYEYTFEDSRREKGMEWVQKYLRMKHVIVFKLSHDVLQFNFYDHSKLVLSSHGNLITHIDKHHKMTRWALSEVLAQSLQYSRSATSSNNDPEAAKFNQKLVDKLKYCKEVLISIRNASASGGTQGSDNGTVGSTVVSNAGSATGGLN